jgi:hypothetical protein
MDQSGFSLKAYTNFLHVFSEMMTSDSRSDILCRFLNRVFVKVHSFE